MADIQDNTGEASDESDALNEIAEPLGYVVTVIAGMDADGSQFRRFTVSRIDRPASGSSFDGADATREHLDKIKELPVWALELRDNCSITYDRQTHIITDTRTGESFTLRHQLRAESAIHSTKPSGLSVTRVVVRSQDAPTIGQWFNAEDISGLELDG
jgi:hypothetical protein